MKLILATETHFNTFNRIYKMSLTGTFDGGQATEYFRCCAWYIQKYDCQVIFTRDVGYHSLGWWKNPDYERCFHLSVSFPAGRNKNHLNKILLGIFGKHVNLLWEESPHSEHGKRLEVWHYRLFCDEQWSPIMPKGEVYSTQFTERNWKSYSELNKK